jgi:large subunit ribosomal protein L4
VSTVDVLDATGAKAGTVDLPAEVFDVQANLPLMHQVVVAQLAAARQGTHSTKSRGEVSGGGAKPYKQKGTDYSQRTPKKMKAAALRGALSDRARNGRVHVLASLVDGDTPSTKLAAATLALVASSRRVLVVVPRTDELGWKSIRNLATVHAIAPDQLNTYDVLVSDDVVFTQAALDAFLAGAPKGKGAKASASSKELHDLSTPNIPGEPVPSVAPAAGEGTVDTEEEQ